MSNCFAAEIAASRYFPAAIIAAIKTADAPAGDSISIVGIGLISARVVRISLLLIVLLIIIHVHITAEKNADGWHRRLTTQGKHFQFVNDHAQRGITLV